MKKLFYQNRVKTILNLRIKSNLILWILMVRS